MHLGSASIETVHHWHAGGREGHDGLPGHGQDRDFDAACGVLRLRACFLHPLTVTIPKQGKRKGGRCSP